MSIRNELLEEILAATLAGGGTDPAPTDQTYVKQGTNWLPSYKSTGGIRMMWSDDTVLPPSNNEISANNSDLALVTELRISSTLGNGADIGELVITSFLPGYTIYGVVDQKDTSYAGYEVSGDITDNGTWFAVPVTAVTTGATPIDGDALILGVIASSVSKSSFEYVPLYSNLTPVETADQDTGVRQDTMPPFSRITCSVVFTIDANGNQYVIAADGENDTTPLFPDTRLLRSAEPVSGGGDVALAVWYSSVTETYHYSLDVDGGGKTLNQIQLNRKTLINS